MKQFQLEFYQMVEALLQEQRIQEMNNYIQHGSITCLQHSIAVAYYSLWLVRKAHIKCDEHALVRGALLHDYFLYDWHEAEDWHKWHGFRHPKFALQNAKADFSLTKREEDIIRKHMWPLTIIPPRYREAWIVNGMDTCSSIVEVLMEHKPFYSLERRWFHHSTFLHHDHLD